MTPEEVRDRIVDLARGILSGKVDFLEGVRQVASFSRRLSNSESGQAALDTFIAVDSETEDFPLGSARHLWAREALKLKDLEKDAYLSKVRVRVEQACQVIVKNWST